VSVYERLEALNIVAVRRNELPRVTFEQKQRGCPAPAFRCSRGSFSTSRSTRWIFSKPFGRESRDMRYRLLSSSETH